MSKAKVCLWKACFGFLTQGFCRMWPAAVLSSRRFSQQWSTRTENRKQESFISEHNKQRAHTLIFKHVSHVSVWVLVTSTDTNTPGGRFFSSGPKRNPICCYRSRLQNLNTLKHIQRNMWHKTNEWTFQWAGARTISTISWDNISTIYYGFLFLFCCFWFVSIYTSWIVRLLVPSLLSEMPL